MFLIVLVSFDFRQVFALYDSMQEVNRYIPEIEWPFLVLHGESDGITSVRGSKLIFEKARSKDKQLKVGYICSVFFVSKGNLFDVYYIKLGARI